MARKRMVTRTLTLTRVTVVVMDKDNNFKTLVFDRIPLEIAQKSDDKIKDYMNAIYTNIETPLTVVHILAKETYEKQFGMTEETFLNFAEELDESAD